MSPNVLFLQLISFFLLICSVDAQFLVPVLLSVENKVLNVFLTQEPRVLCDPGFVVAQNSVSTDRTEVFFFFLTCFDLGCYVSYSPAKHSSGSLHMSTVFIHCIILYRTHIFEEICPLLCIQDSFFIVLENRVGTNTRDFTCFKPQSPQN